MNILSQLLSWLNLYDVIKYEKPYTASEWWSFLQMVVKSVGETKRMVSFYTKSCAIYNLPNLKPSGKADISAALTIQGNEMFWW